MYKNAGDGKIALTVPAPYRRNDRGNLTKWYHHGVICQRK